MSFSPGRFFTPGRGDGLPPNSRLVVGPRVTSDAAESGGQTFGSRCRTAPRTPTSRRARSGSRTRGWKQSGRTRAAPPVGGRPLVRRPARSGAGGRRGRGGSRGKRDRPRAICGHGRSGKDSAARWLAAHTPLRLGKTTSEVIAPHRAAELGISVEEAFSRRHEERDVWYELGNRLREKDAAYLIRETLRNGEICVGIRAVGSCSPRVPMACSTWSSGSTEMCRLTPR